MKISSTKNPQVPCAGVSYVLTEGQERHFGWSLRGEMKEVAIPSTTHRVTLQRSICDCEKKDYHRFLEVKTNLRKTEIKIPAEVHSNSGKSGWQKLVPCFCVLSLVLFSLCLWASLKKRAVLKPGNKCWPSNRNK